MSDKAQEDLCNAVRDGSVKGVEKALEAGADPSTPYSRPLNYAILYRRVEILWMLVKKGATKHALLKAKEYAEMQYQKYPNSSTVESVLSILYTALAKKLESTSTTTKDPAGNSNSKEEDSSFLKDLLFSEEYSDVQFVCDDGEIIHAHKNILGKKCPQYFEAPFREFWKEDNSGVIEFKPKASSHVMKVIIAFIYTGSLDHAQQLLKEDINYSVEILHKAEEYGLHGLITFLGEHLEKSLSSSTLKETLHVADKYGMSNLKKACFDFIKGNIFENKADLWKEMYESNPPQKRRKIN